MRGRIRFLVVSVNWSPCKGTAKTPSHRALVDMKGLLGDAHRGAEGRGVSLLDVESIERFAIETGIPVSPGAFGENVTTRGLDPALVAEGDLVRIGDVLLEVTALGKTCHGDGCDIFRRVGRCVMPDRGVFCRVLEGGTIEEGGEGLLEPGGQPPGHAFS